MKLKNISDPLDVNKLCLQLLKLSFIEGHKNCIHFKLEVSALWAFPRCANADNCLGSTLGR